MLDHERLYIFMYKDCEVFSFIYDSKEVNVRFLDKLGHFDKAPYAFLKEGADLNAALYEFFHGRSIPSSRFGYKKIMKATNCRNGLELSFKGHGLSLSNHFWFKKPEENISYMDINFFNNPWDDSFGRAMLDDDFKALGDCSYEVPDIVTPGWASKGWIYDNGPHLYKYGLDHDHGEEPIAESLTSSLAKRLFGNEEVLNYELKSWKGKLASASSPFIKDNEELVYLSDVLPHALYETYISKLSDKTKIREIFEEIRQYGIPDLYEHFTKLFVLRSLSFLTDLHFANLALLRNLDTGSLRPAPFFDLANAFGGSKTGKEMLSNFTKGTLFLVYFVFGNLNPDWDYSWYDPSSLEGFEEEVRQTLSLSPFYTPELIENIVTVYKVQKKDLDAISKK